MACVPGMPCYDPKVFPLQDANTPGIVNSIVGAVTTGGSVGYVEASATPNVKVLYVGITRNSNFNVGMSSK